MARTVRSNSHRKAAGEEVEDARDLAAAAEDADLQAHHRLLLCLEQTRRAQTTLAQDWMEELLSTSRTLASSNDPQRWLLAPAGLLGSAWTHYLAAQGSTLAAWSEFQYAVLDEMRTSMDEAKVCVWPCGDKTDAGEQPALVGATWLEDAMKTCERFAAAYGSALAPNGAGAPASH